MPRSNPRILRGLVVILVVIALAAGAWWVVAARHRAAAPAQVAAPPPPEVGVITVEPKEVPLPFTYAGRVVGVRDVEVRALVTGVLLKRAFEEGTRVKEGQFLFQIDPAPYQVAMTRAEAQLQQAQATQR